tara:strand:- start:416 stop:553 length:138 start_codon:yes stop_codon:yes gene_type:complete
MVAYFLLADFGGLVVGRFLLILAFSKALKARINIIKPYHVRYYAY